MRISIVTGPWLPVPPLKGGSTERIWLALAREFAKAGHEVSLHSRAFADLPDEEVRDGVRHVRSGGASQSGVIWLDLLKDFPYALKKLFEITRSDVTVINDFWLPILSPLRKSAAGQTVVMVGRMPKGQLRFYRAVDHFTVASNELARAFTEQAPTLAEKLTFIPCPVDDVFLQSQRPARAKGMRLLYVGRIHPEKGIEKLVDAVKILVPELPDLELRVVGPWSSAQGGAGEQYFEKLKMESRELPVTFTGPEFDPMRLRSEYEQADLFCYPSLAEKGETFGVAPLEAMACGAVPVVSDLRCFEGHVRDGETGFVFDRKAALGEDRSLSEVLRKALASDRASLEQNAARTLQDYSVAAVAEQYLKLFEGGR